MISEQDAQLDAQGNPGVPRLSPDFLIETYLDHQVGFFFLFRIPQTPTLSVGGVVFISPVTSTDFFMCVIFRGNVSALPMTPILSSTSLKPWTYLT